MADDPTMSPDGKWIWTGSEWIPAPPTLENTLNLQDSVIGGDVHQSTHINHYSSEEKVVRAALDGAKEIIHANSTKSRREGWRIELEGPELAVMNPTDEQIIDYFNQFFENAIGDHLFIYSSLQELNNRGLKLIGTDVPGPCLWFEKDEDDSWGCNLYMPNAFVDGEQNHFLEYKNPPSTIKSIFRDILMCHLAGNYDPVSDYGWKTHFSSINELMEIADTRNTSTVTSSTAGSIFHVVKVFLTLFVAAVSITLLFV